MTARLIDLHTDWLLQYACETTVYDPAIYIDVPDRLPQAEGYLQTTSAAVLACFRRAEEWAAIGDPWPALLALIVRIEAEFGGRLLIGPDDYARWLADPDSLTWAVIGIEGFDALVRTPADLDRLPQLFERGVRLFQPVYNLTSALGGSAVIGDERGLMPLGYAFLEAVASLSSDPAGPRPILDLAHLNPRSMSDALAWLEADSTRLDRVLPVYSHGALKHEGCTRPRAITLENLTRLRALGGNIGLSVGPPFYSSAEALKASFEAVATTPLLGQPGSDGIAIGTDFLGVNRVLPGLSNAPEVVGWVQANFEPDIAARLLHQNASRLLARSVGASHES